MSDDSEQALRAERLRLLYRHLPLVLGVNLVNGALVVAALWPLAERASLLAWAGALLAMLAVRTAQRRRYLRAHPDDVGMAAWGRRLVVGSTWAGLTWGAAAVLFVDFEHPLSLLLIVFVIGGMAAGAVTTLCYHPPAFHLFLGTSIAPLTLRLLAEGGSVAWAMAGMLAVFGLALAAIGHRYFAHITENLRLSHEKQRLLEDMEHQVEARTAELETARLAAEDANNAKSRFLAAASHDLRQPLQSMFLFSELLERRMDDPQDREVLARLRSGLVTLKDMLDGLLDLSRLDVGLVRSERATFALRELLDELAAAYRPIAQARDLGFQVSCDPAIVVMSDRQLLARMLRNLVENALRYTERGAISLACREQGPHVRVEVSDTGIGIAPDQLGRIFEEFYQVGNPERDREWGFGLGLSIVRRLSNVLDHPVLVSSVPGKGSTFAVLVPRAETGRPG